MKICKFKSESSRIDAFSLIEVLISVSIVGIMFVAMYAGMSAGFTVVQLARENLRATQILVEKMETIRLYRWEQINTEGFVPTNFTDVFYSSSDELASPNTASLVYTGAVKIVTPSISEAYSNDLRRVSVELTWESANVLRKREMSTFVSKYGLQHYVY